MVLNVLRRKPATPLDRAEVKASAAARIAARVLPMGGAQAVWGARDGATLTRAGFLGNPIGHRAVKLIAEAAASLPLVLQDAERRYDSHPLLRLLRAPMGHRAAQNCWRRSMPICCCPAMRILRRSRATQACRLNCMCCAPIGCALSPEVTAGLSAMTTPSAPRRTASPMTPRARRSAICAAFTRWTTTMAQRLCKRRPQRWRSTMPPRAGQSLCSITPHAPRVHWFGAAMTIRGFWPTTSSAA